MCGIAGIAGTNGDDLAGPRVAAMVAMLRHRGPDACGTHVGQAAALGHARLSIIDLAGGGQPMSNEDGSIWIVFNGEIFNYVELRDELAARGHRFRTKSDTEVIVHLYEDQGLAGVARLNGQWAFAIWDARTATLSLSRDRLGVRPLYYTIAGGQLLFASEVKALFADPRVSREIDPRGLDNIFTFWSTLPPRTLFRDVRELPPGHSLIWQQERCDVTPYWRPDFAARDDNRSVEAWTERLDALLTDATTIRLRSDVPVGAYLSGGLDSSLVAAVATRAAGRPLRTFSIAFDDPEFDESLHQRRVAKAIGSDHRELRCSPQDIRRIFPDVVWHAETAVVRTAPAPMYLLSKFTRQSGCTVVLTGEGADEVFGGYSIFKEAKVRRVWSRFPASARVALLARLYPHLPQLRRPPTESRQALFHVADTDLRDPCFSHLPRWNLTSRLKLFFSDAVRAALADYDGRADLAAQLPAVVDQWDPLGQAQYLEMSSLLSGYILSSQGDRMAMAHGVECRFPFLDPRVVAFGTALPPTLKLRALQEKYLVKRLARTVVPAPVAQRVKQPYRAPEGRSFIAGRHHGYVADLLSESQLRGDGIFNPRAVSLLVRKFREGKAIGAKDDMALVGILSTQIVLDRFVNNFRVNHGSADDRTARVHHG